MTSEKEDEPQQKTDSTTDLKVGDIVIHVSRRDLGYGVLKKFYPNGFCDVHYESCSFSYVNINNFISAKPEIIAKQQNKLKQRVFNLLDSGSMLEADNLYESKCLGWWDESNYKEHRNAAAHKLQQEERQGLKLQILAHLDSGNIKYADSIYETRCPDWWDLEDYKKHRSRAIAINNAVASYPTCSLKRLNELLSDESLGLSPKEIATLKLPKLDIWLKHLEIDNLDQQQRFACARPDKSLLVQARAGSGKTRTLAAIAALAIADERLNPDQVLILAFNTKAANEIGERVRAVARTKEYRNARTFHSLAYRLADHSDRNLIFDDGNLHPSRRKQSQFVERVIHKIMNPAFREKLYDFFRHELKQIERLGSELEGEEYFNFRRAMTDFSLGGDNVKSTGEKYIADFLFEHNIQYAYEKTWSWKEKDRSGKPYKPDFSLKIGGRDLILEHWGIDLNDPNAEVPKWWKTNTRQYLEQIEDKRRFWKGKNVVLIETHAGMLHHGREKFEEELMKIFARHGISRPKLGHEELIKKLMAAPRTISRMAELFRSFISRAKSRAWGVKDVEKVISEHPDPEPRNHLFHELAVRAYAEYEKLLSDENSWDFDDMLASAAYQVRKQGGNAEISLERNESIKLKELKWILIDEFQDFSELYFRLIDEILKSNPNVRIVGVGDDWQAINGFAGAQLSFFNNFDKLFESGGIANISTNYRSERAIVGAGNRIMAGNGPHALARPRAGNGHLESRSIENEYSPDDEIGRLCEHAAQDEKGRPNWTLARVLRACVDFISESIYVQDGHQWAPNDVFILSRTDRAYGLHLSEFKTRLLSVLGEHPLLTKVGNDINLEVMTAHRSKGKEADTVIVLSATQKQFPKIHADNQLLRPFGVTVKDALAEERRLFYVAITRAQHRLLLLTEDGNESPFLKELELSKGGDHLAKNSINENVEKN